MKTIVQVVYQRQHRWLGHTLRLDSGRIAITALQGKVEGVRRQGRPRATWLSEVEGRENLTLHQSSLIAKNRARWSPLAREHNGHGNKEDDHFNSGIKNLDKEKFDILS